ncbi:MAG: helix-turn-helix domain-containing protein [Crocinitomicaceae bacterium]|jgi:excisionase family DNA binding protein|nr:helix-turn-helix domain-containing protein [Crocinitomicaceae bacterium]
MDYIENIKKPSKEEQLTAMESYNALASMLKELQTENPEIEIDETDEKIKIPRAALQLLVKILEAMSQGKPISIVPIATEMTTQAASEFLGCSRPHLVKLLETGEIPYTKVGKHRRVKFEDIMGYKTEMKTKQRDLLIKMMKSDEESGLYDS